MELEALQKLRKLHQDNFVGIKFSLNNNLITWEGQNKNHLIWDDTNQILYMIRPNQSYAPQYNQGYPCEFTSTSYEFIEQLISPATIDELDSILKSIKVDGVITDARIKEILDDMGTIKNQTPTVQTGYTVKEEHTILGIGETLNS